MIEEIIKLIEKHDSIVIFGHINPDGDCYGSAVALKQIIKLNFPNKKVYITGSGLDFYFKFLTRMDKVNDETISHSLGILLDGNDLERMEDKRVYNCLAWAKIDHHVDNGTFTQGPSLVEEDANSTCDILTGLVMKYNWKIDELAANALFLGILTDTGRFQFVQHYDTTFERATFLVKNGANPKILNRLMSVVDEKMVKATGYITTHYKKTPNGVSYISLNQEELKALKMPPRIISYFVNSIGNIKGYPVWAAFVENDDHTMRVEFRSNGPSVQPYALTLGGGGHRLAAGATVKEYNEENINKLVNDLDEIARIYKEEQK